MRRHRKKINTTRRKTSSVVIFRLKTFIVITIIVMVALYIESFMQENVKILVENKANLLGSTIINEGVLRSYDVNESQELIDITYNNSNAISSITVNQANLNILNQNIIKNINDGIQSLTEQDILIPLGSITGINWFYGKGPRIKVKMYPTGYIKTKVVSDFSEMGINQTKHSIYLDISIDLMCMLYIYKSNSNISNQVVLSESIIVGQTPQLYSNTLLESSTKVE